MTLDKFPPQINILFSDPLTILNIWLNLHYFCKDLIDFGFNRREMLTVIEFQFQIPDLAWKELSSLDFYSFFLSLWKLITVTLQVNRLKWHKARSFTNQYMFFFFFFWRNYQYMFLSPSYTLPHEIPFFLSNIIKKLWKNIHITNCIR